MPLNENEGFKYITAQHVNAKVGTNDRRDERKRGTMLAAAAAAGASGRRASLRTTPAAGNRSRRTRGAPAGLKGSGSLTA